MRKGGPPAAAHFRGRGGGFAGVETIASINDFLRDALPFYPNLKEEMLRVVLVHPGEYILPEIGEKLGRYARQKTARTRRGDSRENESHRRHVRTKSN